MGTAVVLGLDIGGANLKAATPDGRAVSVPFALWKQPDKLPTALAELVARFPDATELAVTMTGELCDCFETKREGVNAILDATAHAAAGRPVRVWGTDGAFHSVAEARAKHLTVAAANWHALATYAGRYAPDGGAMLIDIGSTTSDLIPLRDGKPARNGRTDMARLLTHELVYVGVRRTPVFAVYTDCVCAELFATMGDVYVVLGAIPEDASDCDTANGRPLTVGDSLTRLARVRGADREELDDDELKDFADTIHHSLRVRLCVAARAAYSNMKPAPLLRTVVLSGVGAFLGRQVAFALTHGDYPTPRVVSLNDALGPQVSACAPAYAVAVLAAEGRGVIVVKVGGSLYDWPGLGPALRAFVAALAPARVLLVPGGGDFADAVRQLHAVHGLTEEQSHAIALDSLWAAASFLRRVVPYAQLSERPLALLGSVSVLDATTFCQSYPGLPHTWEVTTDSIAARAADEGKADRLILLKSIDMPPGMPWAEAARRGWVDPYFPRALAGFGGVVEAVNLRTWVRPGG